MDNRNMAIITEEINRYVKKLPETTQTEVLDFVKFLLEKSEVSSQQEKREWSKLSLKSAMQGMETECGPDYTSADIKERFS